MSESAKSNEGPGFPETADIETANDEYAARFAGAAGQWMLDVQERITLQLLKPMNVRTVLDVGGGHGQLAIPLCREGYDVTVTGSAPSCIHRIRGVVDSGKCRFVVANNIDLPFADASFDAVICFRLLTHCEQWPVLVKELCRIARVCVVADYPTSQSLNAIAPALFNAKKKFEVNTRTWKLFKHGEITDAFARQQYHLAARRGQFFFPMVIHRMLKNRGLSTVMESTSRALGLNALAGSPVIMRMERMGKK